MDTASSFRDWRKSSHSGANGQGCVEVGHARDVIAVRDTRQHGRGPVLTFDPAGWRAFVASIRAAKGTASSAPGAV
ncbi:MAG: DUF397 domain-containing protein [Streptosporangiaceae bacterium]|nr:DUF397 domain-containing protein [Streptosporangiaceae bacterium]